MWSDERWKIASRCGANHISKSKGTKHLSSGALLEVVMSKKCMPLWREAHLQVKKLKTPHVRSTFRSCDVEKVHADVARSRFRSQNVQSTTCSDLFWKLRCRKSACRWGAKHISKSKVLKTDGLGPVFDVQMSFRVASARDFAPCQKWAKREGFVAFSKNDCISKNDDRRGTFEEDLQRCIFHGRRSTRDMFIRHVTRSGADFLRGVAFGASDLQVCWDDFAWQVQHFVWPGITFSWQAKYIRQVEWKHRKTHWYEAVSFALNFPFLKDVSQNCFVFDVVNFENWQNLAELFRFWCCQVQKLRNSCRIVSVLTLPSSKIEEVSHMLRFQACR